MPPTPICPNSYSFQGKTALLNKLGQKKTKWTKGSKDEASTTSTVGFDVGELDIPPYKMIFSDFAGQMEYVRPVLLPQSSQAPAVH